MKGDVERTAFRKRLLMTGWHLLCAGMAVVEFPTANTTFRKQVLGACFGWHLASAVNDWRGDE
jgi:hypothetical protein